jgi:hypothetical protein
MATSREVSATFDLAECCSDGSAQRSKPSASWKRYDADGGIARLAFEFAHKFALNRETFGRDAR